MWPTHKAEMYEIEEEEEERKNPILYSKYEIHSHMQVLIVFQYTYICMYGVCFILPERYSNILHSDDK